MNGGMSVSRNTLWNRGIALGLGSKLGRNKHTFKEVNIEWNKISNKELEQRLDKLAEVIYSYLCQQYQSNKSFNQQDIPKQRTGTDD